MTMPPVGLEDVLAWLYLPTLDKSTDVDERGLVKTVIKRADKLIRKSEQLRKDTDGDSDRKMVDGEGDAGDETRVFLRPLSRGAVVMLRRQLEELKECLERWVEMAGKDGVRGGRGGNDMLAGEDNEVDEGADMPMGL